MAEVESARRATEYRVVFGEVCYSCIGDQVEINGGLLARSGED